MTNLPLHVAIVMDGNGRWANLRNLPRIAGHHAGAKSVRTAVEFCLRKKIKVLSLFALSVENWKCRSEEEVRFLLSLFLQSLEQNIEELHQQGVRVRIIGNRVPFGNSLQAQIDYAEKLTANNHRLTLVLAINYSGRWDIVQTASSLATLVQQGALSVNEINDELFQKYLSLSDLPEPDLLIRTSGEQRISNFMLWQFAYTEMFFSEAFWPDFNATVFEEALNFYQTRQRRFGYANEKIEFKDA